MVCHAYMGQTQKQNRFTISDVAADWYELMITMRHIHYPHWLAVGHAVQHADIPHLIQPRNNSEPGITPKMCRLSKKPMCVQSSSNDPARYRLRSATGTNYSVPRTRTKFGDRAFSVAGPVVWNSLSAAVRHADSLHSFKLRLKLHFFSLCFND